MFTIEIPPVIAGPASVYTRLCLAHEIPQALDSLSREIRRPFRYEIEYAGEQPRRGVLGPNDPNATEPRFLIHTLSEPVPQAPQVQDERIARKELDPEARRRGVLKVEPRESETTDPPSRNGSDA